MTDAQYATTKSSTDAGRAAAEATRAATDAGARQAKEGARAAEAAADRAAEATSAAAKAQAEIVGVQLETAQQAVHSSIEAGLRSFEGLTENMSRAFGFATPNPDLAEQSAQNIQAVSRASTALAKGVQDAARAWFDLRQKAVRTNLDAMSRFARCRSVEEVVNLQSALMRDQLQQAISHGETIARAHADAIQEATRAMPPRPQPQQAM